MRDTSFWEDIWVGEVPLKLLFPKLYDYCRNKECTVGECWQMGEWTMNFRRSLKREEADQWEELLEMIKETNINDQHDRITWVLEKSGQYTTRSMYRMLAHRGVIN